MKLFGFNIKRSDDKDIGEAFAPEITDDGAVLVASAGFSSSTFVDLDGTLKNEAELVNRYRELAENPEVDLAIKSLVNESIIQDETTKTIEINLDGVMSISPQLKEIIEQEFDNVLDLLHFNTHGYETFKRWYIDGREYFHMIIDKDPSLQRAFGIREIRYLDPRKIRKIKVVKKSKSRTVSQPNVDDSKIEKQNEYFIYNEAGFDQKSSGSVTSPGNLKGVQIAKDAIIHITSGLTNSQENLVLSYLHKAIKPVNQLKCLEDASIIHSLSRAPQRRVFNIEVGNLPKIKSEQYIADMIVRHKNQLRYDQSTGKIQDDRKFITMNEDYWFATRNGVGHKIDTLPPGPNIAENMNIEYFQKKVYSALDVPISRLVSEGGGAFDSRATEISRDELNFQKFIDRLRLKFSDLFIQALEKQLIIKQILTPEDWDSIANKIKFKYARDVYFSELKDREVIQDRVALANEMITSGLIGTFYSEAWLRRNVLRLTDEEAEKMEIEMQGEINSRLNMQKMQQSGMLEQGQQEQPNE